MKTGLFCKLGLMHRSAMMYGCRSFIPDAFPRARLTTFPVIPLFIALASRFPLLELFSKLNINSHNDRNRSRDSKTNFQTDAINQLIVHFYSYRYRSRARRLSRRNRRGWDFLFHIHIKTPQPGWNLIVLKIDPNNKNLSPAFFRRFYCPSPFGRII